MTLVEQLAAYACGARYEQLSSDAVNALKLRVLDSLGCALVALRAPPVRALRSYIDDLGGRERVTLIGGGRTSPDRAALFNGMLVRYLDFNDSFVAPGETCHPSDNLAPVLAAAEYAGRSGRDLLVALAVAYQIQCRLSEVAPVRARGFDHTTQGSYAAAAGVARALGLDVDATADAVAIAGTAFNALRVTRTGKVPQWKGLAYPNTAFGAVHAAFLARAGIGGPREVFEGNKGFMESIAGRFSIDWSREDLEAVRATFLKRFNAEVHAQSTIEGLLELRSEHALDGSEIERVEIHVFRVAWDIIGGGEEGSRKRVETKEEADHSLPYMAAAALLDGRLLPEQYAPDRIARPDVQALLHRVEVVPDDELTRRFPAELACRVRVHLRNGSVLSKEKRDYEGYLSRPMRWGTVVSKFEHLASGSMSAGTRERVIDRVEHLEDTPVRVAWSRTVQEVWAGRLLQGRAASNMTRSSPSSRANRAEASVRHAHALGDSLGLDHDHVGARVQMTASRGLLPRSFDRMESNALVASSLMMATRYDAEIRTSEQLHGIGSSPQPARPAARARRTRPGRR